MPQSSLFISSVLSCLLSVFLSSLFVFSCLFSRFLSNTRSSFFFIFLFSVFIFVLTTSSSRLCLFHLTTPIYLLPIIVFNSVSWIRRKGNRRFGNSHNIICFLLKGQPSFGIVYLLVCVCVGFLFVNEEKFLVLLHRGRT